MGDIKRIPARVPWYVVGEKECGDGDYSQRKSMRGKWRKQRAVETAVLHREVLPIVEGLALRAREVEPPTEEGGKNLSVNDGVRYNRVYVVRCDPAVPDPRPGRGV